MPPRSYDQHCGLAHALDLVGERWAPLVVRELILGPRRFTDLRAGLPGVATNVLAARLRELEAGGVVARRRLPPPAASTVYELTPYGRDLEPVLLALGRWGVRTLGPRRPGQSLRAGWIGVAMRAFARPERTRGLDESYELRVGDEVLHATARDGEFTVAHGPVEAPAVVVETDPEGLLGLLIGAVSPGDPAVRVEGDPAAVARLVRTVGLGRS